MPDLRGRLAFIFLSVFFPIRDFIIKQIGLVSVQMPGAFYQK